MIRHIVNISIFSMLFINPKHKIIIFYFFAVLDVFYQEKVKHDKAYNAGRVSKYTLFEEWVSGLCSALPSDYYYNVSAVDLLGGWLDQTDDEKSKYSEDQAERMITKLLYRELTKHAAMSER